MNPHISANPRLDCVFPFFLMFLQICNQVLDSLALCTGVIITVALKQVDDSPYGYARSDCGYDGFKCCYAVSKKCHDCFSVPKLQMLYLQAFSCFLQNPKPVLSLILSLDKTIGCRTFPPSDCLKMFKLLPEGIKNPCIFHSHGKMITGSGYATPAWGR